MIAEGRITASLQLEYGGAVTSAFVRAAHVTLAPGPCLLAVLGAKIVVIGMVI